MNFVKGVIRSHGVWMAMFTQCVVLMRMMQRNTAVTTFIMGSLNSVINEDKCVNKEKVLLHVQLINSLYLFFIDNYRWRDRGES